MTRTLTLFAGFLLCLLSLQTFAQDYRLIGYRKNVFDVTWTPDDSLRFFYSNGRGGDYNDLSNSRLKFDTMTRVDWDGSNFQEGIKLILTFNQQNLKVEALSRTSAGVNNGRTVYTYDQNNNNTIMLNQSWVNNTWQDWSRGVSTFDVNDNTLTSEAQNWDNTNSIWVPVGKNVYTYDADNNMTSNLKLHYNQNTSQFDTQWVYTYHYTNGLRDTTWDKPASGTETKRVMIYQNGLLSETYVFNRSNNDWVNYYRGFHFYPGTSNIFVADSAQLWDANLNNWKEYRVERHTVDNNNDLVSILYRLANSQTGILQNSSMDTMVYNSGHKVIWDMSLDWDSNSGTFIPGPMCVEDHYYYEQYTNDVKGLSSNAPKVEVFPSPARDNITIRTNFETPEAFKLQIYDMQGRLVFQSGEKATKEYNKNIPLQDLPSGNYVLQIKGTKTRAEQKFAILK